MFVGIGVNLVGGGTSAPLDPDAATYIAAVEAADGQALEPAVKVAINDFVTGCKADGIWDAIKASCIMAGARTFTGALVPLKGTAPTNFNFGAGDYNRKTGLKGNGVDKYLDSNRANNADPQDDFHLAVHIHTIHGGIVNAGVYAGSGGTGTGASNLFRGFSFPGVDAEHAGRNRASTQSGSIGPNPPDTGLFGTSRSVSTDMVFRTDQTNFTISVASQTPATGNHFVFSREDGSGNPEFPVNARLQFYSIGEALDLAALDTRVSDLMTAIDGALP